MLINDHELPLIHGPTENSSKEVEDLMKIAWSEYKYLSAIRSISHRSCPARTMEISGLIGVSPATVSGMLRKLSSKDLVAYYPYRGAVLTPEGEQVVRDQEGRVLVLKRFFCLIGLTEQEARSQAERMGPVMGDESSERLERLVETLESSTGSVQRATGTVTRKLAQGIAEP